MIGHLADSYARGRRDAREGQNRAASFSNGQRRRLYLMGYRLERDRMAGRRELAQTRLDFEVRGPVPSKDAEATTSIRR